MALIPENHVKGFVGVHPGWSQDGAAITKTYEFADFNEAIGFVTRLAIEAEKANHHPDIDIRWNKVTLTLSTHSEGGLTEKDLELADKADGLA